MELKDLVEEYKSCIPIIRAFREDRGIIVNGWLLCEIINDKELELTDSDRKALKRILNKIEKQNMKRGC